MILIFSLLSCALLADSKEYCWEAFNATCEQNEVVLMESARYGRMKVGRCLTREYYIGCSADIMPYVDRKCSGRHECQFDVPETELHKVQPCPKDLMAYMEATYSCIKVAHGKHNNCDREQMILTDKLGYLSSIISEKKGLGSSDCPWVISVSPGQKINISLLDFSVGGTHTVNSHICNIYAILREHSATNTDITVCGGLRRSKSIYLSETNEVQVQIMTNGQRTDLDSMPYFLLKYEAIGCADLKAPAHGWVERKGERMTVSCNHTEEAWYLVCNQNEWIGDFRNCSPASAKSHGSTPFVSNSLPLGLTIAVVIGVALGMVLGILLLASVMTCKTRLKRRPHETTAPEVFMADDSEKTRIVRESDYGYAHVWELQRLRNAHAECDARTIGTVLSNTAHEAHSQFGQHLLLKCSRGNLPSSEHPGGSPLCVIHDRTVLHGVSPFFHEFEIEAHDPNVPEKRVPDTAMEAHDTN